MNKGLISIIYKNSYNSVTKGLLPGNPMDGGAWQATVNGVAKSRTQLSDFNLLYFFHY